jgi:hypothetical protein
MVQVSILGDALCNIDLGLETIDACIGSVGLGHHTADTTSDSLCEEQLLISNLNTSMLVAT